MGGDEVNTFSTAGWSFQGLFDSRPGEPLSRTAGRFSSSWGIRGQDLRPAFRGVRKLPLEEWVGKHDALPGQGILPPLGPPRRARLPENRQKAAVERLRKSTASVGSRRQDRCTSSSFPSSKDTATTIMLDTPPGRGLHKRGYRQPTRKRPSRKPSPPG